MLENTERVSLTQSCPLIELIQQTSSADASIGIKLLIGVNIIPAVMTIVANAILLLAIAKTHSLHTPSNIFLAALCFSDFLVGVVSQPLFLTILVKIQSYQEPASILPTILQWSGMILNGMSFLIVLFITIERYVAVCHPFFYEQKATIKRYSVILALALVYKVAAPIVCRQFYAMYYGVITVISFGLMFYCYKRIYSVIAQKERTVLRLGRIGDDERQILHRNREERSKVFTIFVLLGVFTGSYLPPLGVTLFIYIKYHTVNICSLPPNKAVLLLWSIFFLNISSAINPIVYCIFIKPIKEAAAKLIFKCNNRVSAL